MKKIILSLCLTIMYCFSMANYFPQNAGNVIKCQVEKIGDDLRIEILFDSNKLNISSNEQLIMQPVIVKDNDSLFLPAIFFTGRRKEKSINRQIFLNTQDTVSSIKALSLHHYPAQSKDQVSYIEYVKFQSWMFGAKFLLHQSLVGCADCTKQLVSIYLSDLINIPKVNYLFPAPPYRRNIVIQANMEYPYDKATILPALGNNRNELIKLKENLIRIVQDKQVKIQQIILKGYASPEGSYSYNKKLAGQRVQNLKSYIDKWISQLYFTIDTIPEDWEGTRSWIEKSQIDCKNELLNIIDQTIDPDKRDEFISGLDNGKTLQILLQTVYPALRRSELKIVYDVLPLSVEECKEAYKKHPEQLKIHELYFLASLYKADEEKFQDIIRLMAALFPEDHYVIHNSAALALQEQNLSLAKTYLEQIEQYPESLNNLGVYYTLKGDLSKAISCFTQAIQLGNREAIRNLENVRKQKIINH